MEKDLYKILGISKDANNDQIKAAYRKAAMKWHPDKNPNNKEKATEQFKLVSEAYDVLSDPNKRRVYDVGGYDAVFSTPGQSTSAGRSHPGFEHVDAFKLFEHFFSDMGMNDRFSHMSHGGFSPFFAGFDIDDMAGNMGGNFSSVSTSVTYDGRGVRTEKTTRSNGQTQTTEKVIYHPDGRVQRSTSSSTSNQLPRTSSFVHRRLN